MRRWLPFLVLAPLAATAFASAHRHASPWPDSTIVEIVQDGFGNVLGRTSGGVVTWNAARSSLYGPVEGYPALSLSVGPLTSEHLAWRGKWRDETGLFYWGARPYDPARRNFLSVDPLGHGSDPGLYAAFNGNPAVYWVPMGGLGKGGRKAGVKTVWLRPIRVSPMTSV